MHANNAAAALSRLATCAMQVSDGLPWAVVCRGVVDGMEAVICQTRTLDGIRRVDQMVRVRDYDAGENRWIVDPIWLLGFANRTGNAGYVAGAGPVFFKMAETKAEALNTEGGTPEQERT